MALVVPAAGAAAMLRMITREDLVLKLFTDDVEPSPDDSLGTYKEPQGHGYSARTLKGSKWLVKPGRPAHAVYPVQAFQFDGPAGKIHGYYIVHPGMAVVIAAERFEDAPYEIRRGGKIRMIPELKLGPGA